MCGYHGHVCVCVCVCVCAQDYGVFVSFYGGVTGLAHVSELGLGKAGDKPSSLFHTGQVSELTHTRTHTHTHACVEAYDDV